MQIAEIQGTNIELTGAIKAYIEERLKRVAKLTAKFTPCDVRVDVGKTTDHHKNGEIYFAEFNLTIPGTLLRAESQREDLYAAIDQASDDLRRQVRKYKEKLQGADRVRMEVPAEEEG